MTNDKVWFITGASKGLGLVLAKRLLTEGYKVAATSRNVQELQKTIGIQNNFLPLEVNITNETSVKDAIVATIEKFGSIDAVVNNAGYGLLGSLEELSIDEIKKEFDVNVFATINVIRQVLPQLRKQKSGHIFNVTSIAGWKGDTGVSVYNSSKYAVEGLTDALAGELQPLGIKITAIAPGPFRTNFLGEGSAVYAQQSIGDYEHIHKIKEWLDKNQHGKQLGDPEKAPDVFIRIFKDENPPTHIIMGSDGVRVVNNHLTKLQTEIERWKRLSISTDFIE